MGLSAFLICFIMIGFFPAYGDEKGIIIIKESREIDSEKESDKYPKWPWHYFTNGKAKVELETKETWVVGEAEAIAKKGGSASAAHNIKSAPNEWVIKFTDCDPNWVAKVPLLAKHTINYNLVIPGETVNAATSIVGEINSLDKVTKHKRDVKSSDESTGELRVFDLKTKELVPEGGYDIRGPNLNLKGKYSTYSFNDRTVRLETSLTEAQVIHKSVNKTKTLACEQKIVEDSESWASMSITLTETSGKGGDFRSVAKIEVENELMISGDVIVKENSTNIGEAGVVHYLNDELISDTTSLSNYTTTTPIIQTPPTSFLFGIPKEINDEVTTMNLTPFVAIPSNERDTLVEISSSDENVVVPVKKTFIIPKNETFGDFDLMPVGPGTANVTVLVNGPIDELDYSRTFEIDVENLENIGQTIIFLNEYEDAFSIPKGENKTISIGRTLFNDIGEKSTNVEVLVENSSIATIISEPNFDAGKTTSQLILKGLSKGQTTIQVNQPDIGVSIPLTISVQDFEETKPIPRWVKNIFIWYGQGLISESEVLNAIEYLTNQGIIKLNSDKP